MIDFLLGAVLVALVVRGWLRGLARQALELGVLVVGLFLAFRLSGALGSVIAGMAGTSPDVSRVAAGVVVFLAISVGAAVTLRLLHLGIRALPGLTTMNRVGGAAFAAIWGLALATLVISLLAVLPTPRAVAVQLDESSLAAALTDPDGVPQKAMGTLAGDRVMRTMLRIQDIVGSDRLLSSGGSTVQLPPTEEGLLSTDENAAHALLDLVNRERIDAGADPVAWSPALAAVASAHAGDMYATGQFGHVSASSGGLADRLEAAGLPQATSEEILALAATVESVHGGLTSSARDLAAIVAARYTRVGIGVVSGPLGLMVVEIFGA